MTCLSARVVRMTKMRNLCCRSLVRGRLPDHPGHRRRCAQGKNDAGGGAGIPGAVDQTEPNYVFPYFLVVLSTGLGLYMLGKPTRRKNVDEKETALA